MAANWRFPLGVSGGYPSIASLHSLESDVLTTEDCSGSDDDDDDDAVSKDSAQLDLPPEFNNYWRAAIEKPSNFTLWTKLIAYVEKCRTMQKSLAACRKAYDGLLTYFPLCHIYWMKYADLEQHFGIAEDTEKIYDRAVKLNPLNVTLWASYILYLKNSMDMTLPKSIEKLQGMLNNAVAAGGMEFRSDELWILYIEWEIKQGNLKGATALYDRILTIPTQQYQLHYVRFKQFVSSHSPVEILTKEEVNCIQSKVQLDRDSDQIAAEDSPPGDVIESLTESDMQKFREQIINKREQLYLINEAEVKKRWSFEEGIKRLYFSAAPLNIKQLQNWRRYLEFEKSEGQHERIVILYERCLMTCALYEDFWLAYARYMEVHSVEAARSIFERACRIHLPLKVTLHLQWAMFEEKHGQLEFARGILCNLENVTPGLAMVRLRRVSLERRNGNLQEAERLLREAIEISVGTELAVFYTIKLARLLLMLQRNPEKARQVLAEALQKDPNNTHLHLCLLDIEISRDAPDDAVLCVKNALKSRLEDDVKRLLSQRRLEFLDECGNSITSLRSAYDEHHTLLKEQQALKRKADGDDDEEKNKTLTHSGKDSQDTSTPGVSPPPTASVPNSSVPSKSAKPSPHILQSLFPRAPVPAARPYFARPHVSVPPFVRFRLPPSHMRGPPHPYYNYGTWFQNFGAYNSPPAWNYNRFYPPY